MGESIIFCIPYMNIRSWNAIRAIKNLRLDVSFPFLDCIHNIRESM